DYIILKKLIKFDKEWFYYCPKNIYEIMYLISHSDYFLGTSLHGCITAFAYNTPFIPLNKKVRKLNNYTKTWWSSFIKESIDYVDLDLFIRDEMEDWDSQLVHNALQEQQRFVLKNYERLKSII